MLHKIGTIFFLVAIIAVFLKKTKLHISTGAIGTLSMIIYSVIDFVKDKEITILPVVLASILIILSGTNKVRRKFKWLHIISVIAFAGALTLHIIS